MLAAGFSTLALLSCLPYAAAGLLYWILCTDLFGEDRDDLPQNWNVRLGLPVLSGALSPLAVAAAAEEYQGWLLTTTGAGIAFALTVGALFRTPSWYAALQLGVGRGDERYDVQWWKVVRTVGLSIMFYGAAMNLLVLAAG